MLPFRETLPDPQTSPADGTPVFVLLHFFGGSHREWHSVVPHLQPTHRTVAADLPGFGEAAALEGFTVADMTAHLRELVDHLAPAPVIVVGHSMSGKATMVLAAAPPANLRGVVLVAPSPLAGEPMSDTDRAAMRIANTERSRAEKFTEAGFATTPSDEDFETAVSDVLRSSSAAFHAWADSGTREDWSTRITTLRVPAVLVVGEKDKAIAPGLQRAQTEPLVLNSGGRTHLLPGCAHLVPYERPAELARILLDFANTLPPATA